jgi:cytochrome c oxidase subunit 2
VIVRLTFLADSVAAAGTALLLGAAAMSHAQQDPAAASAPLDPPREIAVVAKRFGFEPSRVEVTEGERVRLVLTSADGVHGVEIKKFKVNRKVPRGGDKVTVDFLASAAGEFPILCSEYCGNGHDAMKGTLVVAARAPR